MNKTNQPNGRELWPGLEIEQPPILADTLRSARHMISFVMRGHVGDQDSVDAEVFKELTISERITAYRDSRAISGLLDSASEPEEVGRYLYSLRNLAVNTEQLKKNRVWGSLGY